MKARPETESGRTPDLRITLSLVAATLIAFVLRIWGIKWGLPDSIHSYSYHPDENLILGVAVLGVSIPAFQLNPHFYNYPSLYIYAVSLAVAAASAWGVLAEAGDAYLVARMLVVLAGTATVLLIYIAGKKAYGKTAGIIAAFIFAVLPLAVVNSHYGTVDVPATFWTAACLAAAAYIDGSSGLRPYIIAGLAAGLAAGTKYNAGLVFVAPVMAHLVHTQGTLVQRLTAKQLWISAGAAVLAFVISTPGVVLWPAEFWHGFSYELWHSKAGHGLVFVNTGPGWLYVFTNIFAHGFGIPLAVASVAAVIYAIYKREKRDLPLVIFFIAYFAMMALSEVRFSRYALPLAPAAVLLVARMLIAGMEGRRRFIWQVAAAAVILYTLVYSVSLDRLFTAPDTRESAMAFIKSNIPAGSSIGLPSAPWFYTPPFVADMGHLGRPDRMEAARASEYNLVMSINDWDPSVMQAKPEYIVISDYEKLDGERAGDPNAGEFLRELKSNYKQIKSFGDERRIMNPPFKRPKDLPHDMKYMHPTIWIWQRQ